MVSLRLKKIEPHLDWPTFKFANKHLHPFHMQSSLPPPSNRAKMHSLASLYLLKYACTALNKRTVHADIARQTYVEAEWCNTLDHVLLLAMVQLYSTCFSRDHSILFPEYKVHSCHIPQQRRFCHSPQLSQHPIWQCSQGQSRTIGQFQAHKPHRCSDGLSHPSHLRNKQYLFIFFYKLIIPLERP